MSEFKREVRYYVIKRKYLTEEQDERVSKLLSELVAEGVKPVKECVVVESDWPMYESTWASIERFAARQKLLRKLKSRIVDRLRAKPSQSIAGLAHWLETRDTIVEEAVRDLLADRVVVIDGYDATWRATFLLPEPNDD